VASLVGADKAETLYTKVIRGEMKFNSWIYVPFDKEVCIYKGTSFSVQVTIRPEQLKVKPHEYQIFPEARVQEAFKAAEFPISTRLDVKNCLLKDYIVTKEHTDKWGNLTTDSTMCTALVTTPSKNCILKSLHFVYIKGEK